MASKSLKGNELKSGGRHWARTSDPQLVELGAESNNSLNVKRMHDTKKPLTLPLTPHNSNKSTAQPQALPVDLTDLAAIVASWPSIPDPIKAAVKAVLAPYMLAEG